MADGDTISGQVRVMRRTESGDELVLGPVDSAMADQASTTRLFVNKGNPNVLAHIQPHLDSPGMSAPMAVFRPGEKIRVEHLSANLEEAIDVSDDEFVITVLDRDLNRGTIQSKTLGVAQNEITSDPTSSKTVWTAFFQETVPDRHEYFLAGPFKAAAAETL